MSTPTVSPTPSEIVGTELVEIFPAAGLTGAPPTTLFATTNQLAFAQANTVTAAATSGAATGNGYKFVITSESLTTAAGSTYTLTLTNSVIAATSIVLASVQLGTSTTGTPQIVNITPASGDVVIIVKNIHSSAAFNGTIIISGVAFN